VQHGIRQVTPEQQRPAGFLPPGLWTTWTWHKLRAM